MGLMTFILTPSQDFFLGEGMLARRALRWGLCRDQTLFSALGEGDLTLSSCGEVVYYDVHFTDKKTEASRGE